MNQSHEPLYDLKELRSISFGDEQFFHEMIALFISQSESSLQEIKVENTIGNKKKVAGILHKMKPSVIVMGVVSVAEIIQQIERLDLSVDNEPIFSDLLLKIDQILLEVTASLKTDLRRFSTS
jgi:HPt (histidine-containing phosphotransfer) domain-containing protein